MPKANDTSIFKFDLTPSLMDYLFGTDAEDSKKNKSYRIRALIQLINGVNGKNNILYQFSDGSNTDFDYSTPGLFFTNTNETNLDNFTQLIFNKSNLHPYDLSLLFTKIGELEDVVLKLENPEDPNNFFNLKVVSFENHIEYFVFGVQAFNDFYIGEFENDKNYSLYFDIKSAKNEDDKFTSIGTISLVDNEITISTGFEWEINALAFANATPYIETIPFSSTGNQRFVLFVANAFDTFEMISGPESASNPVAPPIPNNTLQATLLLVTDGVITIDVPPLVGSDFVDRTTNQDVYGRKTFREVTRFRSDATDSYTDVFEDKFKFLKNQESEDKGSVSITAVNDVVGDFTQELQGKDGIVALIGDVEDGDAATLAAANSYTDGKVASVYKVKGSVADYASLPSSGQVTGDVWNLLDTGANYVWTGTVWDKLSDTIDISGKEDKSNKTDDIESNKLSSIIYASAKGVTDYVGINGLDVSYVERNGVDATAQVGNPRKAFFTINAALDALPSTGGVVKIGAGIFFSPNKTKIKSNIVFQGSGKPITNSTYTYSGLGIQPTISSPTKLVGGTILLGSFEIYLKDNVQVRDLGIDVGLDYCTTYTGGVAQEGLIFPQEYNVAGGLPSADGKHQLQTNSRPRLGIIVNNVSVLCKSSTSAVHAMLIENTLNAKISNVSTYYGIHGLVIKSMGCQVNGLDAHGHDYNGLIFKSNDYAYGLSNTATNIYVTSIVGTDGAGINFVSEQSGFPCAFNNLSNFVVEYTKYGIKNEGITEGNNINNGTIYKTTGVGVSADANFFNSIFSNIDQRSGTTGLLITNTVANSSIIISNFKTGVNTVKGFNLTSSVTNGGIFITNSFGINGGVGSVISGNIYGGFKEADTLTGKFISLTRPIYANDAAADADANLKSKSEYMITGNRSVFVKP